MPKREPRENAFAREARGVEAAVCDSGLVGYLRTNLIWITIDYHHRHSNDSHALFAFHVKSSL